MAAAMVATVAPALMLSRADSPHTSFGAADTTSHADFEGEACRSMLQRLRRVAGQYQEQFEVLGRDPGDASSLLRRTRGLLRAMEAEANDALGLEVSNLASSAAGRPGSPGGGQRRNCDLLKRSVVDLQRRCEDTSAHVAHQAQANDELVQSLAAVKDTNKRYVEQLRSHDGEIAQLTQQQAMEEERIDEALRCHCQEQDRMDEGRRRRIISLREAAGQKYEAMDSELSAKLEQARSSFGNMSSEVAQLKQLQVSDLRGTMAEMQGYIQNVERDALSRLAAYVASHAERRGSASRAARDVRTNLGHHAEARSLESGDSARRHAELVNNREVIQSQSERELSHATSQRQALERSLSVERSSHAEDVTRFEQQCADCIGQRETHEIALDDARHEIARLQTFASVSLTAIAEKEKALSHLRRQTRESDDALALAISGSEHLREQMEEQQHRMNEMHAADLSVLQKAGDHKIAQACEEFERASAELQEQVRAMEREQRLQSHEIAQSQTMLDVLDGKCKDFSHDLAERKSSHDSHNASREEHETKTAEGRKHFAQDKLRLKSAIEDLGPQRNHVQAKLKNASQELSVVRREATASDAELGCRVNSSEARLRDAQAQLADGQFRLAEADALVVRTKSEEDASQRKTDEALDALEHELEQRGRRAHEERKHMELQLEAERQKMRGNHEQSMRVLQSHEVSMRKAQEGHSVRLGAMEREHARADDAYRSHMAQSQRELREQEAQLDALAHDIDRVTPLIAESQQHLQWVGRECEREDQECQLVRRRLEDEIRQTQAAHDMARGAETSLQGQLESCGSTSRRSGQQLTREVAELKRRISTHRGEADARLTRSHEEHQNAVRSVDALHREALACKREKLQNLSKENDRLRQMMFSDTRSSKLQPQPSDGSLQRIQQQRDVLRDSRRELRAGPPRAEL